MSGRVVREERKDRRPLWWRTARWAGVPATRQGNCTQQEALGVCLGCREARRLSAEDPLLASARGRAWAALARAEPMA